MPHAVPEVDAMFEDHGPDRGQYDRPVQEARTPPVRTAQDANGDRESGEIGSAPDATDRGPRAGQRAESGPPDLMWENLFAAMQATRVGEHYDVNSAVRTPVSVEERESLAVDKWLTKCKIDKPNRFSGESAGCGEHVKSFLSEVKRYFVVTRLPVSSWGVMSAHFLKGAALLSWELEFQDAVLAEGPNAVSWDKFEHFMLHSFGLLQPATEIRTAYDAMVQSDYDTVSEFVREFRLKERELVGTPYYPAGGAIIDFIRKLIPAVRRYVQDNAPEEWWTDVKQVYKTALNFELNKRAAVQIEPSARENTNRHDSQSSKKTQKRGGNAGKRLAFDSSSGGHAKKAKAAGGKKGVSSNEPHVKTPEWLARVKANKCGGCGLTGHKFKGTDGVRICPNKKNPAPHDSIARAAPLN